MSSDSLRTVLTRRLKKGYILDNIPEDLNAILESIASIIGQLEGDAILKQNLPIAITNCQIIPNSSSVILRFTVKNTQSNTDNSFDITLPVVTTSMSGILNPAIYQQILENAEGIAALQDKTAIYTTTSLSKTPTQAQIQTAYQIAGGKTGQPADGQRLDDLTNTITYTYYRSLGAWKGSTVQIGIAGINLLGLVKSDDGTHDGRIYVETDGTMSLIGFDQIKQDITNLGNNKVNKNQISTTGPREASTDSELTSAKALYNIFGGTTQNLLTLSKTLIGAINELNERLTLLEIGDGFNGAVSSVLTENLPANRTLVSDGQGKIAYVNAVTSADVALLQALSSSFDSTTLVDILTDIQSSIDITDWQYVIATNDKAVFNTKASNGYSQYVNLVASAANMNTLDIEIKNSRLGTVYVLVIANQSSNGLTVTFTNNVGIPQQANINPSANELLMITMQCTALPGADNPLTHPAFMITAVTHNYSLN